MEPLANHIKCETTGKISGYRDLVRMDAPVWTNSMCNKFFRLSQGWKEHAVTDTIAFISHIYKPKDRRATYVRSVYDIRTQKTDTTHCRMKYYTLSRRSQHTNIRLKHHETQCVNSTTLDVKLRYIHMDVKYFYLNKKMERTEYIMIQIAIIPQEFVEKYNLQENRTIYTSMQG